MSNLTTILKDVIEFVTQLGILLAAISKILDSKMKERNKISRMLLRYTIVSFASDLHKGVAKTRDQFLSIFEQIDEYKEICEKYNLKNHLFEEECEFIDKCYHSLDILKKGKKVENS